MTELLDLESGYAKVHRGCKVAWQFLGPEARLIYPALLPRFDLVGRLDLQGYEPHQAVAAALGVGGLLEIVERGVGELLKLGALAIEDGHLVDPYHERRQSATLPTAVRKRQSRERQRLEDDAVTKRDETSRDDPGESRNVTKRHAESRVSQSVTHSHSGDRDRDRDREEPPPAPPPEAGGMAGGAGRRRRGKREASEIPAELLAVIPEMPALWAERMKTPGPSRKPSASAETKQLRKLVGVLHQHGKAEVRRMIEAATVGGWQTIGDPRPNRASGNGHHGPPVTAADWEAVRGRSPAAQPAPVPSIDIPARLRALADSLPDELPEVDAMRDRILGLGRGDPDFDEVETALEKLRKQALKAAAAAMPDAVRSAMDAEVKAAVVKLAQRLPREELEAARNRLKWQVIARRVEMPEMSLFA